jgi:hypothetical protein
MRRDISRAGRAVRAFRQLPAREIKGTADRTVVQSAVRGAYHGEKTEDLPDFAGLFRSGNRRAVNEGGPGKRGAPIAISSTKELQRKATIQTSSPRPWPNRASFSGGPSDRTDPSASMQGCPPTWGAPEKRRKRPASRAANRRKSHPPRPVDKAAEGKAALEYERERKRRERERAREDATRQMQRARRQQAVDKAQAALDKAEREYASRAAPIQAEMEAIEKRSQAETARWKRRRSGWMRRCGARGARAPRC